MPPDARQNTIQRSVPTKALVLSLAALAVPIVSAVALPELGEELGLLVWLTALVPAFLLAYYRGLGGAAVAVAAAMAALSISQVLLRVFDLGTPDWNWLLLVVIDFLVITIGLAIVTEALHRERRKAESLALVDQLTQLPNRRQAELVLAREFSAAMRGRKLGVVIYDVDHFKGFNDTYGHAVGDDVLRAFGEVLQHYTRRQNVSARYGGEEFISVVSDVPLEGILIFANRVREAIGNTEFKWGQVTVSGGVAVFREGMGSHEVLVAAADRALYAAKEAGRNRSEVAADVATAKQRVSTPRVSAPHAAKRVLVVHDEPAERHAMVAALTASGYVIAETGSPEEAARMLHNGSDPFDVLVTSVVMPRLSGFVLVDRLNEELTPDAPDLRVIYLSESMREQVSWRGVPGTIHRFVQKPVDAAVLTAAVRDAIEEEPLPTP